MLVVCYLCTVYLCCFAGLWFCLYFGVAALVWVVIACVWVCGLRLCGFCALDVVICLLLVVCLLGLLFSLLLCLLLLIVLAACVVSFGLIG